MPHNVSAASAPATDHTGTVKFAISPLHRGMRSILESGDLIERPAYVPSLLPKSAVYAIVSAYEDAMGCASDAERLAQSLGYSLFCFPRMLTPLFGVELSKRLHPNRRKSFVDAITSIVVAGATS